MNLRYTISVLLVAVAMIAGIYVYVNYLAEVNSLPTQEKIGADTSPGEQGEWGTQKTAAEKIDILKGLAKTEGATTTQKQKTSTSTAQDSQGVKEKTFILQNLAATSTTSLSSEDKLKILNSLK